MGILRQAEDGIPVLALRREHQMSSATFYKWRAKYGGNNFINGLQLGHGR